MITTTTTRPLQLPSSTRQEQKKVSVQQIGFCDPEMKLQLEHSLPFGCCSEEWYKPYRSYLSPTLVNHLSSRGARTDFLDGASCFVSPWRFLCEVWPDTHITLWTKRMWLWLSSKREEEIKISIENEAGLGATIKLISHSDLLWHCLFVPFFLILPVYCL